MKNFPVLKKRLLFLALLAPLFTLTSLAYDVEVDGIYYEFDYPNNGYAVVENPGGYTGSVVIPSTTLLALSGGEQTDMGIFMGNDKDASGALSIPFRGW